MLRNCRGMFGINRRGHVPTLLLLPLALVLVVLVLFAFASSRGNLEVESIKLDSLNDELRFKNKFVDSVLDKMVAESIEEAKLEEGNFLDNFKTNLKEEAERRRDPEFGNLFVKVIGGEGNGYDIFTDGSTYNITVKDLFVRVEVGKTEIRRDFELSMKFDENGLKD